MIDIVILEDEKLNADRLKRLINKIRPGSVVLATLDSVADSIEWFSQHPQPDLVLMDIRLSDGLSFEILEKVAITAPIIFTTAYDEYAVKAFKYNSIDYLLKPVEENELLAAFQKMESGPNQNLQQSVQGLLNYLSPKNYRSRFLLPYKDGFKTVLIKDIVYFFSELKITRAKLNNGTEEIVPQTMEELEMQLDPQYFFRANRQFIVHIDAIARIRNSFNGKLNVEIKQHPEVEIIVSRDKAQLLKSWMGF